ncbi:hypothetical protein ACHAXT_009252 [Thalassiosira profunda]
MTALQAWAAALAAALLTPPPLGAGAFSLGSRPRRRRLPASPAPQLDAQSRGDAVAEPINNISVGRYEHKGFNLTYLYKPAAPGREGDRPVVLVHPVGVGLSSWFWIRTMEAYADNPPLYAPDLIGCGLAHGADAWDPEEKGLFFPLSWVEGVEALMDEVLDDRKSNGGCLVVAQGGLAPVGIMLAERNPIRVEGLLLASAPTYADITTAIPEQELQRNYNFLCSPVFGGLAFAVLESRAIIRFFSDLFLFEDKCDEQWLDEVEKETCKEARTPVQAFNAGLLQHRSFEEDLRDMPQPLLVLSGDGDKRASDRVLYQEELDNCKLATLPGCNVLPWENPAGVVECIKEMGF